MFLRCRNCFYSNPFTSLSIRYFSCKSRSSYYEFFIILLMDALCSFCVSLPQEPITLGCTHIMCKSCAQACTNNNEIVCYQCNQRSKLALSPMRSPSPKVGIPNKHILDESLKICSRSIAYIHNQQIYMQQFIEKEIN